MPNFSQVHLIGHLGRDPETRTLPDGTSVVGFSLATTAKRRGEDVTTWWSCSLFGKRGETLAKYLHKGDPVHVWGEPSLRSYTAQDGTARTALECRCDGFSFVGGGRGGGQSADAPQSRTAASAAPSKPAAPLDDDIPFDLFQRRLIA